MKSTRRTLTWVAVAATFTLVVLITLAAGLWSDHDDGRGTPWIVNRVDNICGISAPRQITCPARVTYDRALFATPHMKKMRDEGIDPESPAGIVLRNGAMELIRDACQEVREDGTYCGIWKKILRRDGRSVPNVTQEVLALIGVARL